MPITCRCSNLFLSTKKVAELFVERKKMKTLMEKANIIFISKKGFITAATCAILGLGLTTGLHAEETTTNNSTKQNIKIKKAARSVRYPQLPCSVTIENVLFKTRYPIKNIEDYELKTWKDSTGQIISYLDDHDVAKLNFAGIGFSAWAIDHQTLGLKTVDKVSQYYNGLSLEFVKGLNPEVDTNEPGIEAMVLQLGSLWVQGCRDDNDENTKEGEDKNKCLRTGDHNEIVDKYNNFYLPCKNIITERDDLNETAKRKFKMIIAYNVLDIMPYQSFEDWEKNNFEKLNKFKSFSSSWSEEQINKSYTFINTKSIERWCLMEVKKLKMVDVLKGKYIYKPPNYEKNDSEMSAHYLTPLKCDSDVQFRKIY